MQLAEARAIDRIVNSDTSALFDVTAVNKCGNCPSNRCRNCPMYGIGETVKEEILGPVIEASVVVNSEEPKLQKHALAGSNVGP